MPDVPRIEVHTCNVQEDVEYNPPSPRSPRQSAPDDSFQLPDLPTYADTHSECDSIKNHSGSESHRTRFLSRLRRSLSESGRGRRPTEKSASPGRMENSSGAPRSASPAAWGHSHTRSDGSGTRTSGNTDPRRPASLTLPTTEKITGDDEFEFAQLPGHYSLSVYDYIGDSLSRRSSSSSAPPSRDRAERLHRPTTPTITVTAPQLDGGEEQPARGWMSVASRLSTPDRSP